MHMVGVSGNFFHRNIRAVRREGYRLPPWPPWFSAFARVSSHNNSARTSVVAYAAAASFRLYIYQGMSWVGYIQAQNVGMWDWAGSW